MPPKKGKEALEKKVLMGRPSNTLKMGIVGLPNVGKSTTFNLLSNLTVPAENYPFCTIDPNIAKVLIPDVRYDKLVELYKPKSKVPTSLSVTDIAGLVPGANEGLGLGNAFLSHIQAVDGIYQVVRTFEDEEIIHTEGEVNPVRDLDIITEELCLKDIQVLDKRVDDLEKQIKRTNLKPAKDELEVLLKAHEMLKARKFIKDGEWTMRDIEFLNDHYFLTSKPMVYLANMSESDYKKKGNKWLPKIAAWVSEHGGGPVIPYSAEYEAKVLLNETAEAKKKFCEEFGAPSTINKIIKIGYSTLNLIHFFTCGEDEVRAWTVRQGAKAPQAAGVIHTDFEKGFICAEVVKYEDVIALGSESACKAEGKLQQKGKEYEVQDGDIILFKFNAPSAPKKKKE